MENLPLHFRNGMAGIALIPVPVELLGHGAELDNEVTRKVLGLGFAPFLPPEAHQGRLVVAQDDPGVRAADERRRSSISLGMQSYLPWFPL